MRTWNIYLSVFVLTITNVVFNQKIPKDIKPNSKRRFISTPNSYSTVFILFDQPKLQKKIKIDPSLEYHYFRTGKILSAKGTFNGHLLNGSYRKEYRSKNLWETGNFELGLKCGRWTTFYENGQIETIENWEAGLKHGAFQKFDSLGNVIYSFNFDKNLPHGEQIDLITGDTVNYKRGKKEGIWKVKNDNEEVLAFESYRNGKLDGPKVYLLENDTTKIENYKNGELSGWTIDFKNGDSLMYKRNEKNGYSIIHEGIQTNFLKYKNNQLNGTSYLMIDGDTVKSIEYKNDLLDGKVVDFKNNTTTYFSKGKEVENQEEKKNEEKDSKTNNTTKPKDKKKKEKEPKEK